MTATQGLSSFAASPRLRALTADRPFLVAIATVNAIFGIGAAFILIPLTYGSDAAIYQRGAQGIHDGFYAKDFFYAPLTGILATPLTWVPLPVAALAMALIGLAILTLGVARETASLATVDRVLVFVAALGFVPVTYELITGQVTMLIAAALYPVRERDGLARGIGVGLVLALFAKPMLLPVLVWMLLWRRQALVGTIVAAAAVTVLGVVLLGTGIYGAWVDAVVGTGKIVRPGNMALTDLASPALVLGLSVVAIALAGWAMIRDERRGFVAALTVAMLVAPFTLMYQVSILLLAVRPALAVVPRATRILALVANPAVLAAFIPWAGAVLVAVTPFTRRRPE